MTPLASLCESLLFVFGEPLSRKKLSAFAEVSEQEIIKTISELRAAYEGRGIVLVEAGESYQLVTSPVNASHVEKLVKSTFSEELSKAALDTAVIITYKGPISKLDIEYLRGVNSSFSIRNLLMRGLVERMENPKDARSYLYRITGDFLKHLGVERIEDLPRYAEFHTAAVELPEEKQNHE